MTSDLQKIILLILPIAVLSACASTPEPEEIVVVQPPIVEQTCYPIASLEIQGLALGSMSVGLEEDPRADELIGKPAPDFALESLDGSGDRRSLRELADTKVALLTFWGVG